MYTLKDIVTSRSPEKKKIDLMDIWVFIVVRPLSFIVTWLMLKIRISAKQATEISVLISLISTCLVLSGLKSLIILGLFLFNFWIVFDCVDGNIARVTKTSSVYGEFIDGISGYIFTSLLYVTLSYAAFVLEKSNPLVIFAGGLTSLMTILPRLVEHKAKGMFKDYYSEITTRKNYSLKYIIGLNIAGMAGLSNPLYFIAALAGKLTIYVYIYCFIHSTIALISISGTLKKLSK